MKDVDGDQLYISPELLMKIRFDLLCEIFQNENANRELLIKSTAQVPLSFDRDKEMKSTSRVKIEIKAIMNAQGKLFRQKTAKSEMQRMVEKAKSKGEEPDYYIILRNSIVMQFIPDILFCVLHCFFAEGCAIFYSYYIGDMIRFIKDPDSPVYEGAKLVGIFISAQFLAQVLRNRYILYGF